MIKIKDGGKTTNLDAPIVSIGFDALNSDMIEFWVVDKNNNDSLSYLTIEEACALAHELKAAIRKKIDMI